VDDAQDDSWKGCFTMLLYLVAKPSHVGVDVDGLAYPLTGLRSIASKLMERAFYQSSSCLVAVVGGGAFLPGDAYPMIESS
jgi:hypothetical protein